MGEWLNKIENLIVTGFKKIILVIGIIIGAFFWLLIFADIAKYSGTAAIIYCIGTFIAYRAYKRQNKGTRLNPNDVPNNTKPPKNLLNDAGVIFGKTNKGILVAKTALQAGHILIVGGSGTGKSRGVAIPTLLTWNGAGLVIDIKRELSSSTATYRSSLGQVYTFDPELNGDKYNPLDFIQGVDDAQELARNIIQIPPKGDPFWAKNAQAILAACAYQGSQEDKSLSDVCKRILATDPKQLIEELTNAADEDVRLLASSCRSMPEQTLGGVFAELRSNLLIFATDKNLRRATEKSDFLPSVLEKGATVYLRLSEKQLAQYKGLWSCMISQFFRYLSGRADGATPPILILLDELPRLGKIDGLLEGLSTLRSRNVHVVSIVQSVAQLDMIYGQNERKVFADLCPYKLLLSATDPETQKYFSDLAGTEKRQQVSINNGTSTSGGLLGKTTKNKGTSFSLQEEKIYKPEQLAYLERPILFSMESRPFEISKAFWDQIPKLKARAKLAAIENTINNKPLIDVDKTPIEEVAITNEESEIELEPEREVDKVR